jgi:hypothetical protein
MFNRVQIGGERGQHQTLGLYLPGDAPVHFEKAG